MSVCPTCGGKVVPCPRCGAPVGGKFCSSCGAALDTPAAAPSADPPAAAAAPHDAEMRPGSVGGRTLVGGGPLPLPVPAAPPAPVAPPAPPPAPEPPVIARPAGEDALTYAHGSAIAPGAAVVVEEGQTFVGLADGRVAAVHGAGRHVLAEGLSSGYFVRGRLAGVAFGGALGSFTDTRHASGSVRAFGQLRLDVADPSAFVLGAAAPGDSEAVLAWVKTAALAALKSSVGEALGRGDVTLARIASQMPPMLGRAAEIFKTSPAGAAGMAITFNEVSMNVADLVEPPPPAAAAPPPAPQAHAFAPGRQVLVQWSDGNRYPGQVVQEAGDRCLVSFSNGRQDWIPTQYLSTP